MRRKGSSWGFGLIKVQGISEAGMRRLKKLLLSLLDDIVTKSIYVSGWVPLKDAVPSMNSEEGCEKDQAPLPAGLGSKSPTR